LEVWSKTKKDNGGIFPIKEFSVIIK